VQSGRNVPSSQKKVLPVSLRSRCTVYAIVKLAMLKSQNTCVAVYRVDVSGSLHSHTDARNAVRYHSQSASCLMCSVWAVKGRMLRNEYKSAWLDWPRVKCHTIEFSEAGGGERRQQPTGGETELCVYLPRADASS